MPAGFREVLKPQIEPRLGLTWDLTGAGTTVLHSSAGLFHQARLGGGSLGNLAANPPFIHNPIIYYGFLSGLLVPGASLANRPATVEALESDYTTPSSLNWSIGLRRDIGWGTAVDATYAGYKSRNMEMYYDLNGVPRRRPLHRSHPGEPRSDGRRNRDTNRGRPAGGIPAAVSRLPEHPRPRQLRPTVDYHSLQLQVNRRYTHGVQFGAAYTLQRARGARRRRSGQPVDRVHASDSISSTPSWRRATATP